MNTLAPLLSGNILGSISDSFAVAEWTDEGGSPDDPQLIAPLHLHHNDDEAWYVLEGALCVQIGNEIVELQPGSGVMAPRRIEHTFWNPTPGPTRYLLIMTPKILTLINEVHTLEDRSREAIAALFAKYDSTLL